MKEETGRGRNQAFSQKRTDKVSVCGGGGAREPQDESKKGETGTNIEVQGEVSLESQLALRQDSSKCAMQMW